jgi:hypothetical protein
VREALQRAQADGVGASCHDLMSPLCGVVDGPRDLSTNRKHLAGFGE